MLIFEAVKTCPVCKKDYRDDLNYCLDDGSPLPGAPTYEMTNRPTEVLQQTTNVASDISNAETIVSDAGRISSPSPLTPPTQKVFQMSAMEPASRMGCVLSIGQVAAALAIAIGLGFVGIFYTLRENTDVAMLEPQKPEYSNSVFANATSNSIANENVAMNSTSPPTTESGTPRNSTNSFTSNKDSPPQPTVSKTMPANESGSPKNTDIVGGNSVFVYRTKKPITGGVLNGKAIELPQPPYPPAARAVRASGTVTVQVLIDESGRVVSANAVSGHPLLRAAAASAARSAKFKPTFHDGQPARVSGVISYNFVL
ncbi:MAG: TonB family protein [Pyrinomonadaceae bacterium]